MEFVYLLNHKDTFFMKNIKNGAILEFDNEVIENISNNQLVFKEKYKELINNAFNSTPVTVENEVSFVIVTNTNCNLQCSYCYENNITGDYYRMISGSDERIYDFITRVVEYNKIENVYIEFTGGEPLINKNYIYNLVNKLNSKLINKNIVYSLVTNGTLLNIDDIEFFNNNNFKIQVTLDGDKKFHNLERKGKNITDSFDLILKNILLFLGKTNNINIVLRININKQNKDSIFSLVSKIITLFNKYLNSSLNIYFSIIDVSSDDINYISCFEGTKLIGELYYLFLKNNIIIPSKFNIAGNCMARNNNSVTILPDGNLVKCYSLVGYNDFFNELNIEKIFDIKDIKPILSSCNNLNCPIYSLCMGGCGYKKLSIQGDFNTNCNYNSINYLNKLLYIFELITDLNIEVKSPMEMVKFVKIKEVCFK